MIVFLGALWALWGAWWLRRVELRREHDATIRALGLSWVAEGFGPTVRAAGTIAGRTVEIRFRRALFGSRTRACVDGALRDVPDGADIRAIVEG